MTGATRIRRIGTPYSPGATRVMLLGSGELGKEVVIALQRLGVEVIAVDRYSGAPAQQVAHRFYTINMSDPAEILKLVNLERPHLIVPEIEAIATEALVEIEQRGIAEVIPNARAVQLTMNREGIRRLAAEQLGLPTSAYRFASSAEEVAKAAQDIGYPCLVKPVMSSSGKGQSLLRGPQDIEHAWNHARSGSRVDRGRVIIEALVAFDYEITLLTVRGIDPETGDLATYFSEPIGHIQQDGDYVESWQPQPMDKDTLDIARSVAGRITTALGGRGVFGVELFIRGNDVYFSEVSPRPHDTGMVTMCSQRFSEFELHARAILGLPVDVTLVSPGASAVIYGGMEGQGVGFEGLANAMAVPESDVRLFGKPTASPRRRMGVALATAEDIAESRTRASEAASRIRVVR